LFSVHFHALLTDFLSLLLRKFKIENRNCGQFSFVNDKSAVEAVRTCSLPSLRRRKPFKTASRQPTFCGSPVVAPPAPQNVGFSAQGAVWF